MIDILAVVWYIIIALLGAVPLYFAVLFFHGDTGIFKAALVNLLCAGLLVLLRYFFSMNVAILGLLPVLLIYKVAFRLGWVRAFFVLLLQGLIILLLRAMTSLFGIRFIGLGDFFLF